MRLGHVGSVFVHALAQVLRQLKACGLVESVRIASQGLPHRLTFADFLRRYDASFNPADTTVSLREAVLAIITKVCGASAIPCVKLGHTRVFLRDEDMMLLERHRLRREHKAATIIQAQVRTRQARQHFIVLRGYGLVVLVRPVVSSSVPPWLHRAVKLAQRWWRSVLARRHRAVSRAAGEKLRWLSMFASDSSRHVQCGFRQLGEDLCVAGAT